MKISKVKYSKVEICRNCGGAGFVIHNEPNGDLVKFSCSVCGATGKVRKTKDVTITIEPA